MSKGPPIRRHPLKTFASSMPSGKAPKRELLLEVYGHTIVWLRGSYQFLMPSSYVSCMIVRSHVICLWSMNARKIATLHPLLSPLLSWYNFDSSMSSAQYSSSQLKPSSTINCFYWAVVYENLKASKNFMSWRDCESILSSMNLRISIILKSMSLLLS